MSDDTLRTDGHGVVALTVVGNLIGVAIPTGSSLTEPVDIGGARLALTEGVEALRVAKALLGNGALGTDGYSVPALVVVEDLVGITVSSSLTISIHIRGS